jgi:hypothetical protein
MRVIGRSRVPNVDRPEPAQPQRCDACGNTGNPVEQRDADGVLFTVCINVNQCSWRAVKAT